MCHRLCARFHVGTKAQDRNFCILANINFSVQTTKTLSLIVAIGRALHKLKVVSHNSKRSIKLLN